MSDASGGFRNSNGRRRSLPAPALFILHFSFCLSSAAEPAPGTVFYHTAYPEASAVAVVGSPPRWLAVVDNEVPRVALFPLEPQALKIHAPALSVAISPVLTMHTVTCVSPSLAATSPRSMAKGATPLRILPQVWLSVTIA